MAPGSEDSPEDSQSPVLQAEACNGVQVAYDGSRIRLHFAKAQGEWTLEMPVDGLPSLMKALAEAQQKALPRTGGNPSLRVLRRPVTWSLERDMADESLALILVTEDGFEWCFVLDDAEIFRMAECLRDERTVTLPAAAGCQ